MVKTFWEAEETSHHGYPWVPLLVASLVPAILLWSQSWQHLKHTDLGMDLLFCWDTNLIALAKEKHPQICCPHYHFESVSHSSNTNPEWILEFDPRIPALCSCMIRLSYDSIPSLMLFFLWHGMVAMSCTPAKGFCTFGSGGQTVTSRKIEETCLHIHVWNRPSMGPSEVT